MPSRLWRNLIVLAVVLVVSFPFALTLFRRPPRNEIPYSEFLTRVEAGQVTQVEIGDGTVTGKYKDGDQFTTYIPPGDTWYLDLLKAKGVQIRVEPRSRSTSAGRPSGSCDTSQSTASRG